eukprot:s1310_g4.t2
MNVPQARNALVIDKYGPLLATLARVHGPSNFLAVVVLASRPKEDSTTDVLEDEVREAAPAGKNRAAVGGVLRLVDEIMSLTLIEAADLCDLCQEKLAPGDGAPIPGRMPFPHPMGMFPGMPMPGAMPAMPAPGMMPQAGAPAAAPAAPAADAAPAEDEAPKEEVKKEEKKKEVVSVKLVSFEAAKKINVVKEVRAITQVGLKEAKDLVESAPKVVKKGVPFADAEAMRDKLTAAGAEATCDDLGTLWPVAMPPVWKRKCKNLQEAGCHAHEKALNGCAWPPTMLSCQERRQMGREDKGCFQKC